MQSIRRMARHKNKPKKGAAAVSPAEIPAGETEVIVEKTVASVDSVKNDTPVMDAAIDAPAPVASVALNTTLPTFTQIGMAGMIGMLGSVAEPVVAVAEPVVAVAEPVITVAAVAEPVVAAETEVKESEPKIEVTKEPITSEPLTESVRPATATVESAGFYGYIRSFFKSLGGAVNR